MHLSGRREMERKVFSPEFLKAPAASLVVSLAHGLCISLWMFLGCGIFAISSRVALLGKAFLLVRCALHLYKVSCGKNLRALIVYLERVSLMDIWCSLDRAQ